MKKIIIKKGEEKIKIPIGIFVNGYTLKANVIQYNKVVKQSTKNLQK
jgi:hypothetical protein